MDDFSFFCDHYGSCNFFVEAILYNFWWTTETFIRICSEKYKIPTPDVPQSISPRVPEEAAASLLLVSVTQSQSQILLLQHFTRELTKLTTFKVVVIISRWGGVSECQTCRSVGFKLSWHGWQVRRCSVTLEVGTRVNINNEGIKTVCWW